MLIKLTVTVLLALVFAVSLCTRLSYALDDTYVETYIKEVYIRLAEAEKRGADVSEAAFELNKALGHLVVGRDGYPDRERVLNEALSIAQKVDEAIPLLIAEGEERQAWRNITMAFVLGFAASAAGVTYLYGGKMVWSIWLRLRRGWMVYPVRGNVVQGGKDVGR